MEKTLKIKLVKSLNGRLETRLFERLKPERPAGDAVF